MTVADIARVGPGTPGGEWFRRYWLVVGTAQELYDIPQAVKILGEDLVLFRDQFGKVGLLGEHCPHRGASLEYGDIEDGGLRCPYHGWLFNVDGQCLEMPAEPKDSKFCEKVKHQSYPVKELGGFTLRVYGTGQRQSAAAAKLCAAGRARRPMANRAGASRRIQLVQFF